MKLSGGRASHSLAFWQKSEWLNNTQRNTSTKLSFEGGGEVIHKKGLGLDLLMSILKSAHNH